VDIVAECRVLVADDDDVLRETLAEILRLEGFEVEVARDGLQAVLAATRVRPSVVLLDMRMPIVDGWEVARQLSTYGADVPILVMSAAVDAEAAAHDIEADGWFNKPLSLEELLSAVLRFCA
jgi:two-component system response regulator MprA